MPPPPILFILRASLLAAALGAVIAMLPAADTMAADRGRKVMSPAKAVTKGSISVSNPWARASAGRAANGAVYFTIANKGPSADRLTGVEAAVARKASLHSHTMSGGIMRMRAVKGGLTVAPGSRLYFAPGGTHVMLMGLKAPLKAGESFPLTLIFQRAGRMTLHVPVRPIGAGAPGPMRPMRPMHHGR